METTVVVVKEQQEVFTPSLTVTNKREKTCKELIKSEYRKECEKLTWLFAVLYGDASEEIKNKFFEYHGYDVPEDAADCGEKAQEILCNYGLEISYNLPEDNRSRGYLRWLVSWGGPSDEWRFYFVPGESKPYKIEYIYSDWFDSAKVVCTKGRVANLLWDWLYELDTPDYEYRRAKKESEEF